MQSHCERKPDHDTARRYDVRKQMPAVRNKSRRSQLLSAGDEHPTPNGIKNTRRSVCNEPLDRCRKLPRIKEAGVGLTDNQQRRDNDHNSLDNRAEVLDFVMTKWMVCICRSGGD